MKTRFSSFIEGIMTHGLHSRTWRAAPRGGEFIMAHQRRIANRSISLLAVPLAACLMTLIQPGGGRRAGDFVGGNTSFTKACPAGQRPLYDSARSH